MTELPETKWRKPDPRFIKLNVDAAFFAHEGIGATAAILRDNRGNFIAAHCKFIAIAADAITTKAMAMRDGLLFANSLGFSRIEVESDSLQVINFCSGQTRWWDEAAVVFAECIDICSSIGKVTFKHCLRSYNNVAHVLANHSYHNKSSFSWLDEPLDFLMRKLVDDVSVF
ncbi:hypothetical protein VPH35_105401 [Triticum aestivum]|uniref:RNase H type-1 domain-containing protein n=1 Tax=Triticum turgidum subsp. durum TaxID=4567 RepID=A0A9R0Y4C1_TRITD|nr:unnamed protein product [Triticum turgidum subsp. durum]